MEEVINFGAPPPLCSSELNGFLLGRRNGAQTTFPRGGILNPIARPCSCASCVPCRAFDCFLSSRSRRKLRPKVCWAACLPFRGKIAQPRK